MSYRINIESLKRDLSKSNKQLAALSYGAAKSKFDAEKRELLKDFKNHAVTKELEGGADTDGTILGYGNLFSFIGFEASDDPTAPLQEELAKISLPYNPKIIGLKGNILRVSHPFDIPTVEELAATTPQPSWNIGGNWVKKIEKGISGLEHYLQKLGLGRSGGGIEVKGVIRNTTFKGVDYLTGILKRFKDKLK